MPVRPLKPTTAPRGSWSVPNALDTVFFGRDVAAVTHKNLTAFLLPKLFSRDDVVRFDALVTAAETGPRHRPRNG